MNHEQLIIERAAKAFGVSEEHIMIIGRLMGGMSHLTYHIRIKEEDFTYRIIGEGGNLFVDRRIEYDNLVRIEPLGINNETIFFDTQTGDKAARFVKGHVLSDIDFEAHLNTLARTLHKLHDHVFEDAPDYGLVDRLSLYESYTQGNHPKYLELKKLWIKRYQKSHANKPKVFCHNDAQRSNIVIGDQLYLLDWEYAGNNEFYYDIASFGNIRFEDAFLLLEAYLGRKATAAERDHVRFYRMFQALQWHQVASYKAQTDLAKIVGFDFNMLAHKYLDLAERLWTEIKKR
ncbi:MAG: phosphotransferase family protein [Acholeplasmataceae bacterium]|nr:phosphotransferase family protein [Acholeplasmataceae bacterium]